MDATFSLGRTGETTLVRVTRSCILPGGARVNVGESISVTADYAAELMAQDFAVPATPPPASEPARKMQQQPSMKKG